jgi:hypothetical protein
MGRRTTPKRPFGCRPGRDRARPIGRAQRRGSGWQLGDGAVGACRRRRRCLSYSEAYSAAQRPVRAVRSASPSPSGPARTVPLGRELGAVWADTRHSGTAVQLIRGRHDERAARCEASRRGGSAPAASKRPHPNPHQCDTPGCRRGGSNGTPQLVAPLSLDV